MNIQLDQIKSPILLHLLTEWLLYLPVGDIPFKSLQRLKAIKRLVESHKSTH